MIREAYTRVCVVVSADENTNGYYDVLTSLYYML